MIGGILHALLLMMWGYLRSGTNGSMNSCVTCTDWQLRRSIELARRNSLRGSWLNTDMRAEFMIFAIYVANIYSEIGKGDMAHTVLTMTGWSASFTAFPRDIMIKEISFA
jgi:hypothetical protein